MRCDRYPVTGGGVNATRVLARVSMRASALLTMMALIAVADAAGPGTSGVVVPGGAGGRGKAGDTGPLAVVTLTLS